MSAAAEHGSFEVEGLRTGERGMEGLVGIDVAPRLCAGEDLRGVQQLEDDARRH
jgi:hypothetical protein